MNSARRLKWKTAANEFPCKIRKEETKKGDFLPVSQKIHFFWLTTIGNRGSLWAYFVFENAWLPNFFDMMKTQSSVTSPQAADEEASSLDSRFAGFGAKPKPNSTLMSIPAKITPTKPSGSLAAPPQPAELSSFSTFLPTLEALFEPLPATLSVGRTP